MTRESVFIKVARQRFTAHVFLYPYISEYSWCLPDTHFKSTRKTHSLAAQPPPLFSYSFPHLPSPTPAIFVACQPVQSPTVSPALHLSWSVSVVCVGCCITNSAYGAIQHIFPPSPAEKIVMSAILSSARVSFLLCLVIFGCSPFVFWLSL